ncbi:MAG: TonB-dependent receptor [Acidobacteria bacterium]|nr:TonB-dependent receptor [Acidobacteriota bacterium]
MSFRSLFLSSVLTAGVVAGATLYSPSAMAQTAGVGNIVGHVSDSTGAAVPGATVDIINMGTGVKRSVTTNGAGDYNAPFLQPGQYEVVISGANFGKFDRKNLPLTVGQVLTVDAALQAGSVNTTIEVTSEVPLLDPDKTEVSHTVGQELVSNLPVNTRNFSAFVLLTPNVVPDGGSGLLSFRGISGLYNQNYVDGANNNQMLFSEARGRASGAPYVYPLDAIKEFQAETSNYSVEFGQAVGGQVNAITKSGTNNIHGDLFYYLRYPTLNALDPQTKYTALHNTTNAAAKQFLLTQPTHQQHQFGGSIGGPIIKDRLFYFFTFDGFRKVGKALYYNTNTISATPTGSITDTSVVSPTQCPNNNSTKAAGDPLVYYLTQAQCQAAVDFVVANSFAAANRFAKQNTLFPRIDWHINAKNDMFVDFLGANFDSTYGYSNSATFTNSSPSTNGPTSYHERFFVGGLTSQLSDRSVNQIHWQWGRDLETAGANAPAPSVSMGAITYGMPNALPRTAEPDEHRFQFTDVFSTVRGRHSLKVGGDINIVHEVMINLFQGGGVYSYNGKDVTTNFGNWASDVFHGVAGNTDPYAGYRFTSLVQTTDILNPSAKAGLDDFWIKMWDAFAEDNWKITPHFTLTVGIRWDLQLTPAPIKNNTNFPPLSTLYSSTIKNTNRFQPRVAFAWQPYEGTVVRGGYGLFSGLNQGSTYYAMRVENGVVQVNYNYGGCGSSCNATSAAAVGIQFPNLPFTPPGPDVSGQSRPPGAPAPAITGGTSLGSQSFHGLSPDFVPPIAHEAELGIEQKMPGKMTLGVGYVGTRGLRLPIFVDANLIGRTPTGLRSFNVLSANTAGATVLKQITVPYYRTSDRAIPSLTSYNTGFSVANTWYHSLAVSVKRPFQNGLSVLASYTWSHATDTGQVAGSFGTFYGGDTPLDPNDPRKDYGNSDNDIRNRGVISVVYQPRIYMSNRLVKNLVDGFMFTATDTASGGQPIFGGMSGTVSGGSGGNIYGGAISSSSGFATTGRSPHIGRNSIYAPGYNNLDMRVSRKLPIHDSIYMDFYVQAYNVLNHKIITNVNSTYSSYVSAAASGSVAQYCPTSTAVPAGSTFTGCIYPFAANSAASAFRAPSSTSNFLYGARQLEFVAKLFF